MNNKATIGFSGWTEAILIGVMFIVAIGIIIGGYNDVYSANNDASFGMGLSEDATRQYNNFTAYQQKFETSVGNGSASFTSLGLLVVSTAYDLILYTANILWSFITGNWIVKAVALMRLPLQLGYMFQLLYLLTIGFIILRIIFKPYPGGGV